MRKEIYTRPDGLTEERYWCLCSISSYGKITQVGKRLQAVFVIDSNGDEVNKKSVISKCDQLFTEDIDFYSSVVGVDVEDVKKCIGLENNEFHKKIMRLKKNNYKETL